MHLTKEALLKSEDIWLSEEEDTDEWYEKGIKLYKQLSRIDHFNFAYYTKQQVNLLLEKARNKKMHYGNMLAAEKLLKQVIDIEPNHPEIYYRLAFINAHSKKWEAVLFYANEALDHGLSVDEEIKISALMGHAYRQIGLKQRGNELIEHAKFLDDTNKWAQFISNYEKRAFERHVITKQQREESKVTIEEALEKARKNLCCILSLYSQQNCLITSNNDFPLSLKEAELLAYLIQMQPNTVSSKNILNHIWPELSIDNPNSTVVKRTVSSLRNKLANAFDTISRTTLISSENNGYKLNLPVDALVFKGINFNRLSCY